MKRFTALTILLIITIFLSLPFPVSAQTATLEPIDQSALSVQTKTIMVPQTEITGVTGFEQESQKFIKALNEGGLDNVTLYLHPQGGLSRGIAKQKTTPIYHLMDHWFKSMKFTKFIENKAPEEFYVITSYTGTFLPLTGEKIAELKALSKEEGIKQMDAIEPIPATLSIVWLKTEGKWLISHAMAIPIPKQE